MFFLLLLVTRYLLQTSAVRKQIQTIAQGISVLGRSKRNLAKIQIRLPCREEQMEIVTLLKNLDRKIEVTEVQLNQTQQFKKGLLQQMFV
jgi:type I restriction enzyme S subunit